MGRIVKFVAQSGLNIRSLLSSRRPCSTASFLDIHAVDNQLIALQQEQLKMQKELEMKLEKLDMGIEMKHAKLVARQEARMVAIANDSAKGFCELNGRINASDAKWNAALEGIKAEIEGARYEVIKYCVGAFMFGGFVVGVMTHACDAIKY